MEFDALLTKIGEFGAYQQYQYFFLCLVGIPTAFHNLGYVFWAARPDHWCAPPSPAAESLQNLSHVQWKQLAIPLYKEKGVPSYSKCSMFERDYVNITTDNVTELLAATSHNGTEGTEECNKWSYDTTQYKSTIVTDFNLVCGRKWLASTTQSMFMSGRILGTLVSGHLADRYGRRLCLMIVTITLVIFSILTPFMPEVYSFSVCRFFLGVASTGLYQTAFVIVVEIVGPKWRVFSGTVFHMWWAVGYMAMAGIAYSIRDHFILQLVSGIPPAALLLVYCCIIPESPRWLLVSGREEEAHQIITRMAKMNKAHLPDDLQVKVPVECNKTQTFVEVMRAPFIRRIAFFLFFIWFTNSIVYYGLSLNSSSLAGNDYINFAIAGAVEIPANGLALLTLTWCGRRWPLCVTMMLAGCALLATLPTPPDLINVCVALAMCGKFAITCSFSMIYVHTAELFPTSIRSLGLGICNFMARVGGVLAPFAMDVGEVYTYLPLAVFGVTSFIAAFLMLMLPETKGQKLPETLEDGEMLCAKNKNNCSKCFINCTSQGRNAAADESQDCELC